MNRYDQAQDMLNYINPSTKNYLEWIEVAIALQDELGDTGLSLWDSWSARDGARYKPGECSKKWESLKKEYKGRPITFGTLVYMAKNEGWTPPKPEAVREIGWDEVIDDGVPPAQFQQKQDSPNIWDKAMAEKQKEVEPKNTTVQPDTSTSDNSTESEDDKLINALTNETGIFTDIINNSRRKLKTSGVGIKYLRNKRGLSDRAINEFRLGYIENFDFIKRGIMIPTTDFGYTVRNIDRETNEDERWKNNSYNNSDAINVPLGLDRVVRQPADKRNETTGYPEPIFICEGYLDAVSFFDVDADAIALNGTGNAGKIINALSHFNVKRPLILALDNDETGIKKQSKIFEKLQDAKFLVYEADVKELYGGYKDANEFLVNDKNSFRKIVDKTKILPVNAFDDALVYNQAQNLNKEIELSLKHPPILTGFDMLDSKGYLDGGLYAGLYIIGAISSLGKTSFILQIADNIASQGTPVLYFSLEMSKFELMARSISRNSYIKTYESYYLKDDALTVRGILDKRRWRYYSEERLELLNESKDQYFTEVGKNLLIYESLENPDFEVIKKRVMEFENIKGRAPVVFIDYLQLLGKPRGITTSMTDKQIVDKNVFALKRLSRDLHIPIIAISSFNRENYNNPVSMTSFKESGAIEYSSDVLLGMENNVILPPNYDLLSSDQKKAHYIVAKQRAREKADKTGIKDVKLTILKNRNGKANVSIDLMFYGMFNYYREYSSNEWKKIKAEEINERERLGLVDKLVKKKSSKKKDEEIKNTKAPESVEMK